MIQYSDLMAFCSTCPPPDEVTAFLNSWGFRLSFTMGVDESPEYMQMPSLPAQFHYVDESDTEVIFLAGRDHPLEEGERLPDHASRFWISPGRDRQRFGQVCRVLAARWFLRWQPSNLADRSLDHSRK